MNEISSFTFEDTVVKYITDKTGAVGLVLVPAALTGDIAKYRTTLGDVPEVAVIPFAVDMPARAVDSLVQVKCVGDPYTGSFAQGRTMRFSESVTSMKYQSQKVEKKADATIITTTLVREGRYKCSHILTHYNGHKSFDIYTVFENIGADDITLEMLSSFSLDGITPFDKKDASEKLYLHRFRSAWSSEGRHECRSFEDLHLETTWSGICAASERFGQVGSEPVRGFFPFIAVEDRCKGVFWGAQLAWAGTWQMEAFRRQDAAAISGGLGDREFGHWMKTIKPGECFITPTATAATAVGNIDTICQRLTDAHKRRMANVPQVEKDMPIVFNEWCTTWGIPAEPTLLAIADRIKDTPIKYLVIDAGWYAQPGISWGQAQGDWLVSKELFPNGLKSTADQIRKRGLIPGIWFEFETVGPLSIACKQFDSWFLKRDGYTIISGERRFWDFRKPEVIEYLTEKVIDLLEDCGFGYLKVDYNETIGIGADGDQSQGESLRAHIEGVQGFFRRIKQRMPQLVIENCASGGHRLEPSMLALTSMSSFSDAHETKEIPIVAANLHRLVLPAQSQVWAVLRENDSLQRIGYSLAATFLGRMCISGDILSISQEQFELMKRYQQLYRQCRNIIADGFSHRFGPELQSVRHAKGWQAVLRVMPGNSRAMLVVHSFGAPVPDAVRIELPSKGWKIAECLKDDTISLRIKGDILDIDFSSPYSSAVAVLTAENGL